MEGEKKKGVKRTTQRRPFYAVSVRKRRGRTPKGLASSLKLERKRKLLVRKKKLLKTAHENERNKERKKKLSKKYRGRPSMTEGYPAHFKMQLGKLCMEDFTEEPFAPRS